MQNVGKLLSVTAVAMVLAVVCLLALPVCTTSAYADEGAGLSKSKTATPLDENYTSTVSLSLPAEEEQLVTDVVFVLDKSTSADLEEQAIAMLDSLRAQVTDTNAKVNVGVVIFNKVANVTCDLSDLETSYEAIVDAISADISSGTNMHAGLLAGQAMLDADTSVSDDRKYLILVSDGLSYYFCQNNDYSTAYTITSLNGGNDGQGNGNCAPNAGLDCWDIKYGWQSVPDSWDTWMTNVEGVLSSDYSRYVYEVGSPSIPTESDSPDAIKYSERASYPVNADLSLYYSYQLYQNLSAEYNCYAVCGDKVNENYPFGHSFMNYLANGEDVNFDQIENDIVYLLDAGSTVVDVIGYDDTYNNNMGYHFDFVNDVARMELTVGGVAQDKTQIDENTYGFGAMTAAGVYPYVVTYYPNGVGDIFDECFVWDINVPVEITNPVCLSYDVVLTDPTDVAGTYDNLFTNNSATLYAVDTQGTAHAPELFEQPFVSYTVAEKPVPAPDPDPDPDTTPTTPTTPVSTATPAKTVLVQTGDNVSPMVPLGVAAVASIVALGTLGAYALRRRIGRNNG